MISFRKEIYKLTPYQKKADVRPPCSKGMDVMFIIDITGSMNGSINNIIDNVVEIEQTISRLSKGNPYRVGACFFTQTTIHSGFLSAYGIEDTPKYLSRTYYNSSGSVFFCVKALGDDKDFQESIFRVKNRAIGGGNTPEPLDLCLREFINTDFGGRFEDEENSRFIIFITDATISGNSDNLPTSQIKNEFYADADVLREKGVISFIFNTRREGDDPNYSGKHIYEEFTRRIPESKAYFGVNPLKISEYVVSSLKNGCGDLLTEQEEIVVKPISINKNCIETDKYDLEWSYFASSISDTEFVNPKIRLEIEVLNGLSFSFKNVEYPKGTYSFSSDAVKNGEVSFLVKDNEGQMYGKIVFMEEENISKIVNFDVYIKKCKKTEKTIFHTSTNKSNSTLNTAHSGGIGYKITNGINKPYADAHSNPIIFDFSSNTGNAEVEVTSEKISKLIFHELPLNYLDVSENLDLEFLNFTLGDFSLSTINLSNNTKLKQLTCYANKLNGLDISTNNLLQQLDCGSNNISTLDVSEKVDMTILKCNFNRIPNLDLSKLTKLIRLNCDGNNLTELNISNNKGLLQLRASNNNISSIDLSNNTKLTRLSFNHNKISSLDLTHNTQLTSLQCYHNYLLTSLNISNCILLETLEVSMTKITELDVSIMPNLVKLKANLTPTLTTIYVSTAQKAKLDAGELPLWEKDDTANYVVK